MRPWMISNKSTTTGGSNTTTATASTIVRENGNHQHESNNSSNNNNDNDESENDRSSSTMAHHHRLFMKHVMEGFSRDGFDFLTASVNCSTLLQFLPPALQRQQQQHQQIQQSQNQQQEQHEQQLTPVQFAFKYANESACRYMIDQCVKSKNVDHIKQIFGENHNNHRNNDNDNDNNNDNNDDSSDEIPSVFYFAIRNGHTQFAHDMIQYLKQQLLLLHHHHHQNDNKDDLEKSLTSPSQMPSPSSSSSSSPTTHQTTTTTTTTTTATTTATSKSTQTHRDAPIKPVNSSSPRNSSGGGAVRSGSVSSRVAALESQTSSSSSSSSSSLSSSLSSSSSSSLSSSSLSKAFTVNTNHNFSSSNNSKQRPSISSPPTSLPSSPLHSRSPSFRKQQLTTTNSGQNTQNTQNNNNNNSGSLNNNMVVERMERESFGGSTFDPNTNTVLTSHTRTSFDIDDEEYGDQDNENDGNPHSDDNDDNDDSDDDDDENGGFHFEYSSSLLTMMPNNATSASAASAIASTSSSSSSSARSYGDYIESNSVLHDEMFPKLKSLPSEYTINFVSSGNVYSKEVWNEKKPRILHGFFEERLDLLPYHVRQCLQLQSQDLIVCEKRRLRSRANAAIQKRDLSQSLLFETDLKLMSNDERQRLIQESEKKFMDDQQRSLHSSDIQHFNSSLTKVYNQKSMRNFGLEMIERAYPVTQQMRSLNIYCDNPDTMLDNVQLPLKYGLLGADFVFRPISLRLKLLETCAECLETLYCSATVYDLNPDSHPVKITETLTFPFGFKESSNSSIAAVFHMKKVTSTMILLLKLSREYRGEHDETLSDLYLRKDVKPKDIVNVKMKTTKSFFEGEGIYSHFGWSMTTLHDCISNQDRVIHPIYLLNEKSGNVDDTTLINNYLGIDTRKFKTIPGGIQLCLTSINDVPEVFHSVSSTSVATLNMNQERREVIRIKSIVPDNSRQIELESTGIVYPLSANFGPREMKITTMEVSLQLTDRDIRSGGSQVFYPSVYDGSVEGFCNVGRTTIAFSSRTPVFTDEIKFLLPTNIDPTAHLLFKFFKHNHTDSMITKLGKRELMLFSFVKLETLIRPDGSFSQDPICLDIYDVKNLSNYMAGNPKIEGALFMVKFAFRSVAFPTGGHNNIVPFLSYLNRIEDLGRVTCDDFSRSVSHLAQIPVSLYGYVPMILGQLFETIQSQTSDDMISNIAYRSIMSLVDQCRTSNPYIIHSYVKYFFSCKDPIRLLSVMRSFIEGDDTIVNNCSWFMFSTLIKSMYERSIIASASNTEPFSSEFYDGISSLFLGVVARYFRRHLNSPLITHLAQGIGSVFVHLFSILRTDFVLSLAVRFNIVLGSLSKQNEDKSIDIQLLFFKQLFSYKHYIMLFLPLKTEEVLSNLRQDEAPNNHRHYIYAPFTDLMVKCLRSPSRQTRMKGLSYFRSLLYNHDRDERYDQPAFKERVFQIHFDFIIRFLDIYHDWKQQCDARRNELLEKLTNTKKEIFALENNLNAKRMGTSQIQKGRKKSLDVKTKHEMAYLESSKRDLEELMRNLEAELKQERPKVKAEKRQLIACVTHILKNMHEEVLIKWICQENSDQSKQLALIELFQTSIFYFEYMGVEKVRAMYAALFRLNQMGRMQENQLNLGWGVPEWSVAAPKDNSHETLNMIAEAIQQKMKKTVSTPTEKSKSGVFNLFAARMFSSEDQHVGQLSQFRASPMHSPDSMGNRMGIRDESVMQERFVERMLIQEKHLDNNQSFFILATLSKVIELFDQKQTSLASQRSTRVVSEKIFVEAMTRTLLMYLHFNQSEDFLCMLLTYLRRFFTKFDYVLFSSGSEFGQLFCNALFSLCNSHLGSIRKLTSAAIYSLVSSASKYAPNVAGIDVLLMVALSRVLQKSVPQKDHILQSIDLIDTIGQTVVDVRDESQLRHLNSNSASPTLSQLFSFLNVTELEIIKARSTSSSLFAQKIHGICLQLKKLVQDIMMVNTTVERKDVNKKEELLYGISMMYNQTPELRFIWLRQLANLHLQNMQFSEAAECYSRILATVFQHLQRINSNLINGLPLDYFYSVVSTSVRKEVQQQEIFSRLSGSDFSESGIISLLCTIIEFHNLVEQYEHMIPLTQLLIRLLQKVGDYSNLSRSHIQIGKAYSLIEKSDTDNSRQYSTYYRLNFIGDGWNESERGQFIFKMPKTFKLQEAQRRVQLLFSEAQLIPSPKAVDESTLEPRSKYLQFHSVKPYVIDDVMAKRSERKTKYQYHMNVRHFYYEVAFANSGKLGTDVTDIHKRRVILTLEDSFPSVLTKLRVISESETVLSPIESAIDNMDAQIMKLEEVLRCSTPNVENLQMILQGSVRAGVNGGPKDIVENFLASSSKSRYDRHLTSKLNDRCQYFLFLCELGLRVDSRYAQANRKAMHQELAKGFHETKNLFSLHVHPSSRAERVIQEWQDEAQRKQVLSTYGMRHENWNELPSSSVIALPPVDTRESTLSHSTHHLLGPAAESSSSSSSSNILLDSEHVDEIDDLPNMMVPPNRNYKMYRVGL